MTRKEILENAIHCVCGDRDEQYGTPENSFKVIAELWNAYLSSMPLKWESDSLRLVKALDARDVGIMMCLFKIARVLTGEQKTDSYVDAAGYIACAGEVATGGDAK